MPKVRCSVSNCTYWGEGGDCNADAILVEIDAHANSNFNTEFGGDLGQNVHHDYAENSKSTMCHTFKKKS